MTPLCICGHLKEEHGKAFEDIDESKCWYWYDYPAGDFCRCKGYVASKQLTLITEEYKEVRGLYKAGPHIP
jgi:hypothetical protein